MPAPIQASDILTWGYTADTPSAIVTDGYANNSDRLVASATVTTGTVTSTSIQLTAASPTGGLAPYTYQWFSSMGGTGFAPTDSTAVSGATTLVKTFSSLIPSTAYGFQLQITDSSGQVVLTRQYAVSTLGTSPTVASARGPVITGQVKISVTGTAVQFPENIISDFIIITNNSATNAVIVGGPTITATADGTGNGDVVAAGGQTPYQGQNTSELYLNGTAGDWLSFIGN